MMMRMTRRTKKRKRNYPLGQGNLQRGTPEKKPSRGAVKQPVVRQVDRLGGSPPADKDRDPHALEGATNVKVATH